MLNLEDIIPIEVLEAPLPEELEAVDSTIIFIDGPLAAKLLERNVEPEAGKEGTNRKSSPFEIKNITDDILSGRWYFNHQGVGFDVDGHLFDGANRLKAIIAADKIDPGVSVPMKVTINVPPKGKRTTDLVRRRTLGDQLTMEGHVNTLQLAAMARLCYLFETCYFDGTAWSHWNRRPSRTEVENFVDDNKADLPTALKRASGSKVFAVTAVAAAIHIIRKRRPAADLETFLGQLFEGENLHRGDPVFALRRWGINFRNGKKMPQPYEQLAVILKAFKAFADGDKIEILVWKSTMEAFPRP